MEKTLATAVHTTKTSDLGLNYIHPLLPSLGGSYPSPAAAMSRNIFAAFWQGRHARVFTSLYY